MKLIRAQCGAHSGPSQRAELSVWPKWNIDILSHNAASRTQFSQLQLTSYHNMSNLHNIKTNRWHIVGFQHGHCSRLDRGNFKITLNIKKAPTPNFQINHFLLCPKCWKVEWGMIAKYAAGLSIPQICSLDMPLGRQWFIHMMAYIAKSLCLMLCCLFFYAISVVSLCDYQCHRPVRVISSAAQAAVVQQVCRHGEMLRLINRKQSCLNTKGDFNVSLQLCRGFPHCKITSVELAIALQGFAKIWEINNCHFNLTCIKQLMRVEISK